MPFNGCGTIGSSDHSGNCSWIRARTCSTATTISPGRIGATVEPARSSVNHIRLRLHLDGTEQVERTARDLTARESSCCSFFGQREKISSRITVTTALTRIEPRQPTRFEKKRNMPGLYPLAPV
ncbi:hypothetical protein F8274_12900 [Micromonospora sp. AMSO31t]|nr:hypothetical protein F8274_12900 [Micromonospora sp. AMSO31t]